MIGIGVGTLIREFTQLADTYQLVQARLRLVTNNTIELYEVSRDLFRVAQDTRTGFEEVASLYARMARVAQQFGTSQADLLDITRAVSQALQISGASAQEAQASMLQLSQAIGSGKLGGDEFRSLSENAPRLMQAVADSLKVPIGALKEMAKEGKLTAQVIINALREQKDVIAREFAQIPLTLSQAWTVARNAVMRFVGEANEAGGLTRTLAQAVVSLGAALSDPAIQQGAANLARQLGAGLVAAIQGVSAAAKLLADNFDLVLAGLTAFAGARAIAMVVGLTTALWGAVAAGVAFAATPFGAIVTALAAAAAAIVYFRDATIEMGGRTATVWDYAVTGVEAIGQVLGEVAREAGRVATDIYNFFARNFGEVVGKAIFFANQLISIFIGAAKAIHVAWQGTFDAMFDPNGWAATQALRMGAAIQLMLAGKTQEAFEQLFQALSKPDRWTDTSKKSAEAFGEAFKFDYVGAVIDGVGATWSKATAVFEGIGDRWGKAAADRAAARIAMEVERLTSADRDPNSFVIPKPRAGGPTTPSAGKPDAAASYFDRQRASMLKTLETLLQLDDAAENYYETIKRGGKGLTEQQIRELASLSAMVDAFKKLDAAGKGLQGAMDAIQRDVFTGATNDLAKLIVKQGEARKGIEVAQAAMEKAKIGSDTYAAAQAKLAQETDRLDKSNASYQLGLENIREEFRKGTEAIRDNIDADEFRIRTLRLEIDGSEAAETALKELTRQRAIDLVHKEREADLAPLRRQLAGAEKEGYQDIADALREVIREREALFDRRAAAAAELVDVERLKQNVDEAREAFQQPFIEAGRAIQSAFADTFENIFRGGVRSFKDFGNTILDIFIKLAAQIAALLVFQPVVGGALDFLGASPAFKRSLGILPEGSGGGFSLFGGGGGGFGNILRSGGSWLDGIFGTGGAGSMSAVQAAGSAAAAEIGSVATGGGALGLFEGAAGFLTEAIPYVGAAVAAISIITGLFKKKPSNLGAEFSVFTDAGFSTQFQSDKHTSQDQFVRQFAEPLQSLVIGAERAYGVTRRDDATIGAIYGRKEGSSFFYDRGPRDGGIENRQSFAFDPDDEASIQAALDSMLVAFLKDADWSGVGARLGEQAGKDVATALENSAATSLTDLLADIDFAKSFQEFADLADADLDPVAFALRSIGAEGKSAATQIGGAVDSFRQKATDLGLGAEVLESGLTRADEATQGLILSMLGLEAEVDPVAAATARANGFIGELTPILEAAGFSAERVGEIVSTVFDNMVTGAQQAADATRIAFETSMLNTLNTAIYGSNYQPPADSFLYGLVGHKYAANLGPGGGTFAPLVQAIEGARGGSLSALQDVYARANANVGKGVFTQAEAQEVMSFAAGLFDRWQNKNRPSPTSQPANDNGSGSGSSGGGTDNSARDALIDEYERQIDSLRILEDAQQDAARNAERLAGAFRGAADGLRQYRLGLLTTPTVSPLSPGDQLKEALRQQADAFARVLAGGEDAPEAARELQTTTDRVLELNRLVFGSSKQGVDIFKASIAMLEQAEAASINYEAQQLAALQAANAELGRIKQAIDDARTAIDGLRSAGSGGSTGGGTGGGGGGSGGGGVTPPAGPAFGPGQPFAFGFGHLGRDTNESADTFIRRMFPQAAATFGVGTISEEAGYNWAQSAHPSGLTMLDGKPITNAAYYGAARKGGYTGAFAKDAHYNYLYENNQPVLPLFFRFIDELRKVAHVPYEFFGVPYASGGLVTGGVPGRDSVPAWLMPGERVLAYDQARMIERVAGAAANDDLAGAFDRGVERLDRRLARVEARVAMVEGVNREGNADRRGMRDDLRRRGEGEGVAAPGGRRRNKRVA
ncbi:MAG: tape measure protein [Alphaproteobacteria bacterium]